MNLSDFKGVYSATFTPYDKEGGIDIDMQEKIIDFQLKNGLKGVYLCGSTGEGPMLSEEERTLVVENVVRRFGKRAKIIAHTGHISTETAVKLSIQAEKAGADAVSSIQPYYYSFPEEIEFRYYQELAGSVNIPMIIYVYPQLSGRGFSEEHILKLFDIENVIGAKYTGMDYFLISSIFKKITKETILFSGSDQIMISGLSFGAGASIGMFQNIIPKPFVMLYEHFNAGNLDKAREMQSRINDFIYFVLSKRDMSYNKAVMRYIGFDCRYARKPFKQLTEKEYSDFSKELERFDDLFAMSE